MSTPYSDIYDLFLQQVKDWRLEDFYLADPSGLDTYLQGFLVLAIPSFESICDQSLSRDDATSLFSETLTDKNKEILSMLVAERWMEKEIKDIRQMSLHIADKDFKTYSEAQNLKAKEATLILLRERISQRMTESAWYDFTDWSNWNSGVFGGS